MDNKVEILKEGRILALKIIAESYLISKGNNKTKELFPKTKESSTKELSDGDILVLHHWLMDEYHRVGLDLMKIIESTGEKVVPGKLSQFELKELFARADQMIVMMSVFKNYEEAKRNK